MKENYKIDENINFNDILTIPNNKTEEDLIFKKYSNKLNINCLKNPGKLGEIIVKNKIELMGFKVTKNKKIKCDWILKQKIILPGLFVKNTLVEVKSLRYFNCKGKRGNQGTGTEKILSTILKYSNISKTYNYNILIIFVMDMENDKYGVLLSDMTKKKFNNNLALEKIYNICNDLNIKFIKLSELKKEDII